MSKFILDTRLSEAHYIVCTEAIRRGIIEPEDLNEGRRTMAEQWAFWRNQPPLAAFPSPFAPHIKKGLPNHAIDANSINGASQRLEKFYKSLGIPVTHNVPGEAWHMDTLSASKLRAAAKKIRKERDRVIHKLGETEKGIKFLKYQLHIALTPDGRPYYRPGETRPEKGWSQKFTRDLELAVKHFQKVHHIPADGIVGPTTNNAIDKAYAKAQKNRKRKSATARARARKEAGGL
jgi:hypothetical protein